MTADPAIPLNPGEAVTRWAMSAPHQELFPGIARPQPDRMDYRFMLKGIFTGESPAREALGQRPVNASPEVPTGPFTDVYPGGSSPNVDFSQFCHRPTLIRRAFQCRLTARQAGAARFRVSTCGAMTVWMNDAVAMRFAPFTRNEEQHADLTLNLPDHPVDITVEIEDLHERDTAFFFSFIYQSGVDVTVTTETIAPERIDKAVQILETLEADAVFYQGGMVTLTTPHPPTVDLPIEITRFGQCQRGGMAGGPSNREPVSVTLKRGETSLPVLDTRTLPAGCFEMDLHIRINGSEIDRRIGTTILQTPVTLTGDTLTERKASAAEGIVANASFEPPVAMLLLARGEQTDRAAEIIAAALTTVEQRHDCSDFTMSPLLRIWRDSRDKLPAALRDRLEAAILGYRYWLGEPGNDAMWFWSENHVLCFHIAQYLAGSFFPERTFTNSGRTGTDLARDAQARLHRWFTSIETHGLGEFNSAAYCPIDLFALLTLHDLAPDPDLRSRASGLLDQIFVMTALHTTGGVPAGAQGRAYEKELLAGPATELGSIAAVAFDAPWYAGYDQATAQFCLSDYVPPDIATTLAHLEAGQNIAARYTQGLDHAGKLTLWKTQNVQMSTASDHHTGTRGSQQHVIDVQFAAHPMARLMINHPGDLKPWSERRPSKLAGNVALPRVAQDGNLAFLIYDLDTIPDCIPFVQLFAPDTAFDERIIDGQHMYLRCGNACAAIWCSAPLTPESEGPYRTAVCRAAGPRVAWIVRVADLDDTAGTTALRNGFSGMTARFDADARNLSVTGLEGSDYDLNFDGAFLRNGTPLTFAPLTQVPHVSIDGSALRPWRDLDAS